MKLDFHHLVVFVLILVLLVLLIVVLKYPKKTGEEIRIILPAKPAQQPSNAGSLSSGADWEYLHNLSDEDIDKSDIPDPTPEPLARAVVRKGLKPIAPKQVA